MSVYQGAFSLTRFKIMGQSPAYTLGILGPLFGAKKAGPLKITGITRELSMGWVAPPEAEQLTEGGDWDLSHSRAGEGFILRVRVEKRVVPGPLVKLVFKERLKTMEESNKSKVLGRAAKKQLLDEIRHELLKQALPQVRFLDAFWHEARAELWVYSSGKSSCDLVRELFHKTFCEPLDLTLVPLSLPLFGITDADLADEQHGLISRLKRVLPSGRQEEDTRDQVDTAVSGSAAPLG